MELRKTCGEARGDQDGRCAQSNVDGQYVTIQLVGLTKVGDDERPLYKRENQWYRIESRASRCNLERAIFCFLVRVRLTAVFEGCRPREVRYNGSFR